MANYTRIDVPDLMLRVGRLGPERIGRYQAGLKWHTKRACVTVSNPHHQAGKHDYSQFQIPFDSNLT